MRRLALVVAALSLAAAACADTDGPPRPAAPGPATPGAAAPSPVPDGEQTPPATNPASPPSRPAVAEGPAAVAASLVAAEQAIRNPAVPTARLEEAGRSQQDAYRQLVERPEWMPQVLAAAPASLRSAIRANVAAGAELRALHKPQTRLPPWRIVAPAPAHELMGHYKAAEADLGIPWQYLAAIHLVETRMGRIRGTSVAGAQGPMQFLPSTWARYGKGGDINSNRDAIFAAARLLAANGGPGDMRRALYRYNPTPRYVNGVAAYAGQMRENERTYFGYYHWQVYYRMVDGDRLLPVGYGA